MQQARGLNLAGSSPDSARANSRGRIRQNSSGLAPQILAYSATTLPLRRFNYLLVHQRKDDDARAKLLDQLTTDVFKCHQSRLLVEQFP